VSCRRCVQEVEIQSLYFLNRRPRNSLEVAVKPHRRFQHPVDFFLPLGPLLGDDFAFFLEVLLHVRKRFNDRLHPQLETRTLEVLINEFSLGLNSLRRLSGRGHFHER